MKKIATIAPSLIESSGLSLRRSIAAFVFLITALSLQIAWSQGTVRWAGGTSTAWATASNWVVVSGTPSTPPGAGDAVQIGTGAITNQPTISSPTTIASLTYGNSAASTLTINANISITGAITNTIATTARIHNINLSSGVTLSAASANLSPAVAAANMTIVFNGGIFSVSGNFTAQPTTATTTITLTVGTGTFSVGGTTLQGAAAAAQRNCDITVSTGTLTFSGAYTKNGTGSDLTSSGAASVSFGSNVTNTNGTSFNLSGSTTTFTGSGSVTPTVAMTFGNVVVNTGVTTATVTAAGTLTVAGNLTLNGTAALNGTEAVLLTGASATIDGTGSIGAATTVSALHTIQATADLTLTGTMTLSGAGNRIDNNGTVTAATIAGSVAGAVWTNLGGSTLNVGAALLATGTLTATANSNTVNYNGAGAQAIKATTYHNLSVTKSAGTATFGNTTVNNDFVLTSGTVTMGAFTVLVSGSTQISGTLNITSATGTKTFVGPVTINAGGVWNNSGNEAITFSAGLTHNGTTFTAGTGIYTFDTNPQNIDGTSVITIANLTVTSPAVLTNINTNVAGITVSTALAGTGEFVNGTNALLNITGTSAITTLTASANPNAVNYNGGGAQTVKAATYHHVTLSNAGTKTVGAGGITVNGDLTISGTAVLADGGNQITGNATGLMTMGAGTGLTLGVVATGTSFPIGFTGANITLNTTSTVTYNSNQAQTISAVPTYGNLTLTATAAVTKTLGGALTVNGNLTIGINNTMDVSGSNYAINLAGNWSGVTGSVFTAGTGTVTFNGSGAQQILGTLSPKVFNDVVVNKTAGALTTAGGAITTMNNLTMTQGDYTPPATLNINGTLTLTTGTLTAGTNINISGDWTDNGGTFTPGAGTVTFNSTTAAQAINGTAAAQTFNNMTVNKTGQTLSVGGSTMDLTLSGTMTITAGTLDAGTATNITIGVNWSAVTGSVFTAGTGTVTFDGGAAQSITGTLAAKTFNNVIVNKSAGTLSGAGSTSTLTIDGSMTLAAGTFSAGTIITIDVSGDWTNNGGTFTPGVGTRTVNFVSTTTAQAINGTAAAQTFNNIGVNNTGQTLSVGGGTTALTVNSDVTLTSGTFSTGTAATIDLAGDWINNGGTFLPGSSTVSFSSGVAQAINGTAATQTFNNITVSKSANTLSVGGSTTTLVLNGTMTLGSATFSAGTASVVNVAGDWTNNGGTFTAGSGAIVFNGTLSQAINGAAILHTFNDLILDNSNGLALAANVIINGTLTFTSGNIATGASRITISSTGSVARTSGHVVGNFEKDVATGAPTRIFEIGDATNYTPVQVSFASVTTSGLLTASAVAGDHSDIANSPVDETQSVNRFWTVTNNGVVFTTYDATFTFVAGDIDVGADPNEFIVGNLDGITWSQPAVGTRTATSTEATGMTSFSAFAVGLSRTKVWDGGAATSNWGDASNWSPNGVPLSNSDVVLSGANTISINVAAVSRNTTLNNAGLMLTILAGQSLTISTNLTITDGTLNTEAAFPAVSGTTSIAGGTIGYTGTGSQTVEGLAYNNLVVSGSGTKSLSANGSVAGNLTVSSGTFDLGTNTVNRTAAGGILSISSGASLVLAGSSGGVAGSNFPNNFATVLLNGTVEFSGTVAQTIPALSYTNLTSSSTGTRTLASSGTIGIAGSFTPGTNSYTITGSSVDFNGAGPQSIPVFSFNNLTLSNAGVKTFLAGTTQISGALTISGSASVDATTNSTTVVYNSASPENIAPANYYNLTLTGAGAKTAGGNLTIVNNFDNSSVTAMGTFTLSIGGTITNTGTMQFAGETNGMVFADGTVEYNGTSAQAPGGQTIALGTYANLLLSNSATKRVTGGLVYSQSGLIIGISVTVVVASDGTLHVNGDLDNQGSLTNNGSIEIGN